MLAIIEEIKGKKILIYFSSVMTRKRKKEKSD
jgi:hypothetical protein